MNCYRLWIFIVIGIFYSFEIFANINVQRVLPSYYDKVTLKPTSGPLNKEIGSLFLTRNKLVPEVITLDSGLEFRIVKHGMGIKPTLADLVTLKYIGRYLTGTVFDATHDNGIKIRVAALIPGMQEALQLMDVGSIWELYIPANLGHGERGVPGIIGPNQVVIYTVHLLNVNAP